MRLRRLLAVSHDSALRAPGWPWPIIGRPTRLAQLAVADAHRGRRAARVTLVGRCASTPSIFRRLRSSHRPSNGTAHVPERIHGPTIIRRVDFRPNKVVALSVSDARIGRNV